MQLHFKIIIGFNNNNNDNKNNINNNNNNQCNANNRNNIINLTIGAVFVTNINIRLIVNLSVND